MTRLQPGTISNAAYLDGYSLAGSEPDTLALYRELLDPDDLPEFDRGVSDALADAP